MTGSWKLTNLSLELRKLFTYRLDFWMQSFGLIAVQMIGAFFLWQAIYRSSGKAELQGFQFAEMMVYYLLVPLVTRISRGAEDLGISTEIYGGSLSRYLLYPLNFFEFKFFGRVPWTLMSFLQLIAAVVLLGVFLPNISHFTLQSVALGLLAASMGFILSFSIFCFLELFAFWLDNVWSFSMVFKLGAYFLGGGAIPITFFAAEIQQILQYSPFALVVSFPINSFLGKISGFDYIYNCIAVALWTLVFFALTAFLWRRGLLRFTGVGM